MAGGTQRVDVSVPEEFSETIGELLWLDVRPNHMLFNLHKAPGVNVTLRNIMIRLGATEELLNTKCFAICGPTGVGKTKFINMLGIWFRISN